MKKLRFGDDRLWGVRKASTLPIAPVSDLLSCRAMLSESSRSSRRFVKHVAVSGIGIMPAQWRAVGRREGIAAGGVYRHGRSRRLSDGISSG